MAADDELAALDATAQAELVRSGQVSAEELVAAAVERLRRFDPTLGVLVDERLDAALEDARGTLPDGPFRGVPFLLKDAVQQSAGDRYQHGLRLLRDHPWRSPADTELTARYRRAGLVLLGRTKVPELTLSSTTEPLAHGPTYNPWDLTRSPGGSSGGSAAAVAAGLVPMAHGNDMGGSIRMPASCCGLVGLKPSRSRSPLGPERSEYWGPLTFEHVLTRSVRDSAIALDATAGPALGDMHEAPPPARPWADELDVDPGRLRVGYVADMPGGPAVDEACQAVARRAAGLLESLGHTVEPLAGDFLGDTVGRPAMSSIVAAGCAYELGIWERRVGATADELEPRVAEMIERGRAMTAVDYVRAIDDMGAWGRRVVEATAGVDVVLTPTMAVLPPKIGAMAGENMDVAYMYAMALFSVPFNVSGQPAVSLPLGMADGLPVGVQLVAAPNREDVLFRLAAQVERAAPWAVLAPVG